METKLKILGTLPLLVHSPASMVDPSPSAQEFRALSKKRGKTEADHDRLAYLEWLNALYLEDGHPILPRHWLKAAIVQGAKKRKQGKQVAAFVRARPAKLEISADWKDNDAEANYAAGKFVMASFVIIERRRLVRYRPRFEPWAAEVVFEHGSDITAQDLRTHLAACGEAIGLGDWRPEYGLFQVE